MIKLKQCLLCESRAMENGLCKSCQIYAPYRATEWFYEMQLMQKKQRRINAHESYVFNSAGAKVPLADIAGNPIEERVIGLKTVRERGRPRISPEVVQILAEFIKTCPDYTIKKYHKALTDRGYKVSAETVRKLVRFYKKIH